MTAFSVLGNCRTDERFAGAQADNQHQQADDGGENGPPDENVGEMHDRTPLPVDRDGMGVELRHQMVVDHDRYAVAQLHLAGDDDCVAILDSVQYRHLVAAGRAGLTNTWRTISLGWPSASLP